jgi:hypothetical protein
MNINEILQSATAIICVLANKQRTEFETLTYMEACEVLTVIFKGIRSESGLSADST